MGSRSAILTPRGENLVHSTPASHAPSARMPSEDVIGVRRVGPLSARLDSERGVARM